MGLKRTIKSTDERITGATGDSEHDQLMTEWLATHHILAKDVRAYTLNRRVGDLEIMTLEIVTSGVDKIPASPAPSTVFRIPSHWTMAEAQAFREGILEHQGKVSTVTVGHPDSDRWTGGDRKDEA